MPWATDLRQADITVKTIAVYKLVFLLGKLGIRSCVGDRSRYWDGIGEEDRWVYGHDISMCRAFVERYLDTKAAAASATAGSVGVLELKSTSVESVAETELQALHEQRRLRIHSDR